MKTKFAITLMLALLMPVCAIACWNDSECPNDKVCQCSSTSPTGNCSSEGQCVPDGRDWKLLKEDLVKTRTSLKNMGSAPTISNFKAEEIKAAGNSIEKISLKIEGKTGDPQPQYFTQKVKGNIVNIFDLKSEPAIWGVLKVSGVGTDIAVIEVRASGYPGGHFSSTVTFQVIH